MKEIALIKSFLPELTRYQHIRDVDGDDATFTKIKKSINEGKIFMNVEECDILLIINPTHRGVVNYVGGNSFYGNGNSILFK